MLIRDPQTQPKQSAIKTDTTTTFSMIKSKKTP